MKEENVNVEEQQAQDVQQGQASATSLGDDGVYRVNLNQTEDAIQEQSTNEVPVSEGTEISEEVGEEVRSTEEPAEQKEEVLELINEENDGIQLQEQGQDEQEKQVNETQGEKQEVNQPELPENIQKVVDFMNETGGTLEDYVRLNTDYSGVDEKTLLREYYRQTKSHLEQDEIDFLIEDNFSYDEEIDEERDIKRKKLAYKEEIAKARGFLEDLKGKYYDEVKVTSRLAPDQKEAIEFYNNYKKQQEELTAVQSKASEHFIQQTEKLFNEEFKGFDFKVGDNKYRFKVADVQQTKEAQSDILNAFRTFLDSNDLLSDAQGYHKALFAARNADKIANHFYEQGKADAIMQIEKESKNINMDSRKSGIVDTGGIKVRAVSGDDSSKLRIKIKQ
jgi:hypothetical protein